MATNDPAQSTPADRDAASDNVPAFETADDAAATSAAADPPAPPTLDSVQRERDEAREEAQRYLGIAQRAQADLQNYRRRAEQEKTEQFDRGRAELLKRVAPVLDDLDRALSNLPPEGPTAEWAEGLQLIGRKLHSTLDSLGVERIAPEGQPFDPQEHEAVLQVPRDDVEPNTVISVVRAGYRVGGRVIEPAQVVVATAP